MIHMRRQDLSEAARNEMPGDFLELSSGVTHYELKGDTEGEPVVLIHGNAAPYVTWDNTIEDLCAAGLRVLRYDLFGHGFSDRPRLRTYDLSLYNAQLAELLSNVEISYPVMVVGSSQGGSIGACFAGENRGAVKKLALLAPFFDDFEGSSSIGARLVKTPLVGELLLQLLGDEKLSSLSESIVDVDTRAVLEREVAKQFRFGGKRRAILANWRGDGLKNAASCYTRVKDQAIPTLLTWGTRDKKIPVESMRRLRDLLPGIEYHEIDGAGHLAHYEFPDRINPLLVNFLSG